MVYRVPSAAGFRGIEACGKLRESCFVKKSRGRLALDAPAQAWTVEVFSGDVFAKRDFHPRCGLVRVSVQAVERVFDDDTPTGRPDTIVGT